MVVESSVLSIGYFMPIFSFLLVFIVVYALLMKTGILGGTKFITLFVSFILASFFIVETSLVKFIEFNSSWFSVGVVMLFFLLVILAFLPGKEPLAFLMKNNWFSWAVLGLIVGFFIISSVYVFNLAINWSAINSWLTSDWFGAVLLFVVAAVVSWKIVK